MNSIGEYWDYLVGNEIATEDELDLVTSINGYNEETLDDVLYVRTGYRSLDQYKDDMDDYGESYSRRKNKRKRKVKEAVNTGMKYWYFTKHGVQPGSVPKGVNIEDIKDTAEGSYFLTDKMLTTDELNRYDIKERIPESIEDTDDDVDGFEWEIQHVKTIPDADGFTTQYALYKKTDGTKWITMYGDIDYNPPEEMYADMEFDNEQEAIEFFDDYMGYEEIEDDNVHENFTEETRGRKPAPWNDNYRGYKIRLDPVHGVYNIYDKNGEMENSGFTSKEQCYDTIDNIIDNPDDNF